MGLAVALGCHCVYITTTLNPGSWSCSWCLCFCARDVAMFVLTGRTHLCTPAVRLLPAGPPPSRWISPPGVSWPLAVSGQLLVAHSNRRLTVCEKSYLTITVASGLSLDLCLGDSSSWKTHEGSEITSSISYWYRHRFPCCLSLLNSDLLIYGINESLTLNFFRFNYERN